MGRRALKMAARISRLILAITLLVSGFVKVIDPWGTALKVDEYLAIYGLESLSWLSMGFSIWLCGAELMMGCMLLAKVRIRLVSLLALLSMIIFTIITLLSATILPVEDCGCFGEAMKLTPWQTFFKNLVLLPMAVVVWYRYRNDKLFAFKPAELALTAIFCSLSMGLGIYCSRHLPLIDILPYKIGTDLRSERLHSEQGAEDELEMGNTTLIYRNIESGELREFSLEDSEWQDESRWEWVETRTDFDTPEIKAIVSEFTLRDSSGDITEEVLMTEGKLYMLCVNRVSKLRRGCQNRFAALIKRAEMEQAQVICLTPDRLPDSDSITIGGHPVRCCNIDVHTIKTLLRANNGMVELSNGVITDKRNCRDIEL